MSPGSSAVTMRAWLGRLEEVRMRMAPHPWPFALTTVQELDEFLGRSGTTRIPRVLHQIWLGPRQPPYGTLQSCRDANPGWLHMVWTESNLPRIQHRRLYDAFGRVYPGKADVLRYELLQRYGGVYVDADQLCLRSFDELVEHDVGFFAGFQDLGNPELPEHLRMTRLIANGVIGATARHPILERLLCDIATNRFAARGPAWVTVGPTALTRAIARTPARAVIHPFHEFYPYHASEAIPDDSEGLAKALHYRSRCVSLWGSTNSGYARCRLPVRGALHGRVSASFAATHPLLPATVFHA